MSDKILFVEIFQPFTQYRNPFTFYYAQTFLLPPKSTILGMLQNAIEDWYGNRHKEAWDNLKISIHGGFENIFWNYQRLIKGETFINLSGKLINHNMPLYGDGLTSTRTPVYQQELFNGHLFLFLRGDENLINEIKKYLEKPKKVLYLGRSEDVIFVKDIKTEDKIKIGKERVEGDIKLNFPTYIIEESFPIKNRKYPVFSIPMKVEFKNNGEKIKSKSEITKNTDRKPQFKSVIYTGHDYSILLKENKSIDVEFYKIGTKEIRIINPFGWL